MVVNHEAEYIHLDPIALRKAKIVYNFGLTECNRVKVPFLKCRNPDPWMDLVLQSVQMYSVFQLF